MFDLTIRAAYLAAVLIALSSLASAQSVHLGRPRTDAEVNRALFFDYQLRLDERRRRALTIRRRMAARRPPARYDWIGGPATYDPAFPLGNFYERGLIRIPLPCRRRPVIVSPVTPPPSRSQP